VRTTIAALLCAGLAALATVPAESGGKKNFVATDPEKAGPDWQVQGEYLSQDADGKTGAEVIARGDGNFDVNVLPGGLRGEGGDYAKRKEGKGKAGGGTTTITFKDGKWSGIIKDGEMRIMGVIGGVTTLKKVIRKSKSEGMKPPQGATVLYGGPDDVKHWTKGVVVDGNLLGSDVDSKQSFGDQKLHLEFRLSYMPFAGGQGRSNSGVYPQHRYEVQVLDSFGLKGENNECGGIYSQAKPKVNMCYPPLTWQTYDIELTSARFDNAGKKIAPAIITVYHNGVLIHDKVELKGPTGGGRPETPMGGPLHLQGHGGQVQYRNIWVAPLESGANRKG
jgi:hypothetical protein